MTLPRYQPMLAVPWPAPFSDASWWFEVKWDGVRLVSSWDGRRLELRSRRGNDVTLTYPELSGLRFDRPTVLDGEVVALDAKGDPSFAFLQQRMNLAGSSRPREAARSIPLTYVVFDLLHDGEPLVGAPIEERRARLAVLGLVAPAVLSEQVDADGDDLFQAVAARGLEGVVAKRKGSLYRAGQRSPDWRKVAHRRRLRAVVGGFTPGVSGRGPTFGSLLLGLWDGDRLRFIGAVGSGFDQQSLQAIRAALGAMAVTDPPFADVTD
ncbi:MAG: hypothetical protein ACRDVM_08125, partial [Acidimicrobiia bacterium]